jgi:hypothetical protein
MPERKRGRGEGGGDLTRMDAMLRKGMSHLIGDCTDAFCRQAVGSCGQTPHDKLEETAAHIQLAVKEDSTQEGPEETIDKRLRETLFLQQL